MVIFHGKMLVHQRVTISAPSPDLPPNMDLPNLAGQHSTCCIAQAQEISQELLLRRRWHNVGGVVQFVAENLEARKGPCEGKASLNWSNIEGEFNEIMFMSLKHYFIHMRFYHRIYRLVIKQNNGQSRVDSC